MILPRISFNDKKQHCFYMSLQTRGNKVAHAKAAILKLRVEMTKKDFDLSNAHELLKIDLKMGSSRQTRQKNRNGV